MNVKSHKDHTYVRKNSGSVRTEGPRVAAVNHMLGEYQTDFVELVKRKSRVKDATAGKLFIINELKIQLQFSAFQFCNFAKC